MNYRSVTVETATHIGQSSVLVYSHFEWLRYGWRMPLSELLGEKLKPIVRVKMGRKDI